MTKTILKIAGLIAEILCFGLGFYYGVFAHEYAQGAWWLILSYGDKINRVSTDD